MKSLPSRIKNQPNVKPIFEWKRGIFFSFLTHKEYLLSSGAVMEQFAMESKACNAEEVCLPVPKHCRAKGRYKNTQSLIKLNSSLNVPV